MSLRSYTSLFLRHLAYASALLLGLAGLAERLAPGSVLSYISLWQMVLLVLGIQLLALLFSHSSPRFIYQSQRVLLFGGGVLFLLFLILLVREQGTRGLLLVLVATGVLVVGIASCVPTAASEEN